MEPDVSIEYYCSDCNSIVNGNDSVCSNCGADLIETVIDNPIIESKLRKLINIVAIIFLVFNSIKLLIGTFLIISLFISTNIPSNTSYTTFINFMVLDWISVILLMISSIGLLSRKNWSIKLTIRSLYYTIFFNAFLFLGLLRIDSLWFILLLILIYLLIQSAIYIYIIRKLNLYKFQVKPNSHSAFY